MFLCFYFILFSECIKFFRARRPPVFSPPARLMPWQRPRKRAPDGMARVGEVQVQHRLRQRPTQLHQVRIQNYEAFSGQHLLNWNVVSSTSYYNFVMHVTHFVYSQIWWMPSLFLPLSGKYESDFVFASLRKLLLASCSEQWLIFPSCIHNDPLQVGFLTRGRHARAPWIINDWMAVVTRLAGAVWKQFSTDILRRRGFRETFSSSSFINSCLHWHYHKPWRRGRIKCCFM